VLSQAALQLQIAATMPATQASPYVKEEQDHEHTNRFGSSHQSLGLQL